MGTLFEPAGGRGNAKRVSVGRTPIQFIVQLLFQFACWVFVEENKASAMMEVRRDLTGGAYLLRKIGKI